MAADAYVLDASVVIAGLLNGHSEAREYMSRPGIYAPSLIDLEVLQVFRKRTRAKSLTDVFATLAAEELQRWPLVRVPHTGLLTRIWELRENLTSYDAAYVSLAEIIGANLVTLDNGITVAPHRATTILLSG